MKKWSPWSAVCVVERKMYLSFIVMALLALVMALVGLVLLLERVGIFLDSPVNVTVTRLTVCR